MKKNIFAAMISIATLSVGTAFAVGPDSAGSGTQDYSYVLDSGNSVSVSRSTSTPKATGLSPDGVNLTNPFKSSSTTTLEAKWDYNGTVIGIATNNPYSVQLTYADGFMTNVGAKLTSSETAVLASRSINSNFKVFGGIRLNQFKATVNKPYYGGAANPTLTVAGGYQYSLDTGTATGFAIGAAYEIPEIYFRASIQFNSEIKHSNAKVTEIHPTLGTQNSTSNDYISPASTIIKLRSAITPKMLAFANWRSSQYKKLVVEGPIHTTLGGGAIYDPASGVDYTLGLAFPLSDKFTALIGTAKGTDSDTGNASSLAPFDGNTAQFIGASFKISDTMEINGSYSLVSFGDANVDVIQSPGVAGVADFKDNKGSRVSIGTKISF